MMKIVFGVVGAEGLRNISIDEKFWRLENRMLDQDMVTQWLVHIGHCQRVMTVA
jgi:hypothetical protein